MFLLTVAMIWTVAAITPGPNTLLAIRYALSADRRVAVAAAAGTITGTICWGLAGWLGLNALFQAVPVAYAVLKLVGGLYLVWLGLKVLWALRRPPVPHELGTVRQSVSLAVAYRMGLLTNLANPKSALFVASLFAAAIPAGAPWVHGVAAIAVMVAISAVYYTLLIALLTHQRVAAAYLRAKRKADLLVGAVFVGFGSRLLMAER